jgi:hypothetical protein
MVPSAKGKGKTFYNYEVPKALKLISFDCALSTIAGTH